MGKERPVIEAAQRLFNMKAGDLLYLQFWKDIKLVSSTLLTVASVAFDKDFFKREGDSEIN